MYSIVIPPEYLAKLARIREDTGKPIRRQIFNAIDNYLSDFDETYWIDPEWTASTKPKTRPPHRP